MSSSYLTKKIKSTLSLEQGLLNQKAEIENDLATLDRAGNLRVASNNDNGWRIQDGGCLLPIRKKRVRGDFLICTAEEDKSGEVVFGRAIFNSDTVLKGYKLLTYEAPFFRKGTGRDGPVVKCDFIGLKGAEFCCIELKTNPTTETTQLPYALLEAYSYWVCANWIFEHRKDDLLREVEHAKSAHNVKSKHVVNKITFAVALTKEYADMHPVADLSLIKKIEKAIKNICPRVFAGYWIMNGSVKQTDIIGAQYIPMLTGPLTVSRHKSASEFLK